MDDFMSGQRSMSAERTRAGYSPGHLSPEIVDAFLKAPSDRFAGMAYVDLSANLPKTAETRDEFRQLLESRFALKLADSIDRIWQLPSIVLQRPNDEYIRLLVEARDLFTMGYFYSCVAMCGIVGEKLIKDILRGSILALVEGVAVQPSDEAFDQFERVDVSSLVKFVNKAKLLSDDARRAADRLVELRNAYAHARGKSPQVDALEAINKLHIILEDTVSFLKSHEIVDGQLVARSSKL